MKKHSGKVLTFVFKHHSNTRTNRPGHKKQGLSFMLELLGKFLMCNELTAKHLDAHVHVVLGLTVTACFGKTNSVELINVHQPKSLAYSVCVIMSHYVSSTIYRNVKENNSPHKCLTILRPSTTSSCLAIISLAI